MENSQKLAYQFQYLKEQRDMFSNQLELINASLSNLKNTKLTIENLKNIKADEEILVPIGGIINLHATIKNPEKLLIYVNQDVVIEKDLDGSIEFIEKIIERHEEQEKFIMTQLQTLELNLQGISQQFRRNAPPQV